MVYILITEKNLMQLLITLAFDWFQCQFEVYILPCYCLKIFSTLKIEPPFFYCYISQSLDWCVILYGIKRLSMNWNISWVSCGAYHHYINKTNWHCWCFRRCFICNIEERVNVHGCHLFLQFFKTSCFKVSSAARQSFSKIDTENCSVCCRLFPEISEVE